jgi:hypothetical protein
MLQQLKNSIQYGKIHTGTHPTAMANREKERREREFDLRSFLVWVVVLGVLVAVVLWLLVAVRGPRMLPPPANHEPNSRPGQPRSGVAPDSPGDRGTFALRERPIHSVERVS